MINVSWLQTFPGIMLNTHLLFREIKVLVDKQTVLIHLQLLISFIAQEASEGFFVLHLRRRNFFFPSLQKHKEKQQQTFPSLVNACGATWVCCFSDWFLSLQETDIAPDCNHVSIPSTPDPFSAYYGL